MSSAIKEEIKKFFLLFEGPFRTREAKLENVYELEDPVTGILVSTQNVVNLKTYTVSEMNEGK